MSPERIRLIVGGVPDTLLDALIEVRIDLSLNQPGRCVLRFADSEFPTGSFGRPGGAITITIPLQDGDPVFDGEVSAVEVERHREGKPTLTVIAYDKTMRLAATTNVRTFVDSSVKELVGKLADSCGLKAAVGAGAPFSTKAPYRLQASSDLDMLDLLAARTGADWWCQGDSLKFELLGADGSGSFAVKAKDLDFISVRASANRPGRVEVRGWDSQQQETIVGSSKLDAALMSASGLLAKDVARLPWFERPLITSAIPIETKEEADQVAAAIMRQAASGAVHCEGEGVGLNGLRPGMALEVGDSASLDGQYLVTEVQHRWAPEQASRTRFVAGQRRPGATGAPLASLGSAPKAVDTYSGLVVGKVTNINDKEQRGRVKVRFMGLSEKEESAWARVLIVGAGKGRGSVTLPEVNDEVLVGFEAGDLRKPVVLGGLFNKVSTIPLWQVKGGKVAGRRTTSRKGHYFEMADELDGKEHLLLSLADNKSQFLLAKNEAVLKVPNGNPLKIEVGPNSSIVFDGKGKITIECLTFEVRARQKIAGEAPQMEASARATLKLQGASTEVTGQAKTSVSAGGPLELKGAIVKIN